MINNNIKKIDFFPQFEKCYFKILKTFKFDPQKDIKAAKVLSEIFEEKGKSWNLVQVLNSFENYVHSKNCLFIYGCGPSLGRTIKKLKEILGEKVFKLAINLAADGASKCLDENEIPMVIKIKAAGFIISNSGHPNKGSIWVKSKYFK